MTFKIKDVEIKSKVVLAPMAGVTNMAYRMMCKKYGVGMVCSEMISDKGIFYNDKKTAELAKIDPLEHPVAIQIFGGSIDTMINAAKFVDEKTDADIIDINMGCPVLKVIKADAGSKYLQDSKRIYETVKSIVENVKKPVSVKVRLGWDHNSINIMEVCDAIILAGGSAITIHGRTKTDMYSGKASYELIRQVKQKYPDFPIIANGDITTPEMAKYVLDYTKADAVMVGRGSFGNPFLFTQINEYLNTGTYSPSMSIVQKVELLKEYATSLVKLKGEYIAMRELRGQAGWFIKGCHRGAEIRNKLSMISSLTDLINILNTVTEN